MSSIQIRLRRYKVHAKANAENAALVNDTATVIANFQDGVTDVVEAKDKAEACDQVKDKDNND